MGNIKKSGFTLFEMLLVLVIVSSIIAMGIGYMGRKSDETRLDRAAIQYQQILNAALAYYINNGKWPAVAGVPKQLTDPSIPLFAEGYLPASLRRNPWGTANTYFVYSSGQNGNIFYVESAVYTGATKVGFGGLDDALVLAGKLPLGFATTKNSPPTDPISDPSAACATGKDCWVVGGVTIPGQNLNNARSVNFANIYNHGACVPQAVCPTGMTSQVFVIPVSVSGIMDTSGGVWPIASFTAYARGTTAGSDPNKPGKYNEVASCASATTAYACEAGTNGSIDTSASSLYWRVCLDLVTDKGRAGSSDSTNPDWGKDVKLLAITRCAAGDGTTTSEPTGSDFTVYCKTGEC